MVHKLQYNTNVNTVNDEKVTHDTTDTENKTTTNTKIVFQ